MAITKTKQNWTTGQTVKVGFLSLTVIQCIPTPGDYAPDAYLLVNAAQTTLYKFVPHNGLEKINREEAKAARPPSDAEPWVVADDTGLRLTFTNEDAARRYRNEYTDRLTNPTVTHEPAAPPTEEQILGMAEDYGQWMWDAGYLDDPRGESLVDNAAFKREEIKQALQKLVQHAYTEGRKDQAEATAHRGYVLFGAGAYLLTICKGDERGPELVAHLAADEEKVGRTVGDLGDVVSDKEIPLERVAMRLQFASEDGLNALEQQLRMLRVDHFDGVPIPPRALELLEDALELGQGIWRGDLDKDDREGLAFNLMSSTREYLQEIGYLWKPKA